MGPVSTTLMTYLESLIGPVDRLWKLARTFRKLRPNAPQISSGRIPLWKPAPECLPGAVCPPRGLPCTDAARPALQRARLQHADHGRSLLRARTTCSGAPGSTPGRALETFQSTGPCLGRR